MIHNLQNTQQDHKWLKPHRTFIPATPPCIPTPIIYYFPGSHYHIQHHSTPAVKVWKQYECLTTWEHHELMVFGGGPFLFHKSYWPVEVPRSSPPPHMTGRGLPAI